MRSILLLPIALLIRQVCSVLEIYNEIIAAPSANPAQFRVWNYTYVLDSAGNPRTVSMILLQTSAAGGNVTSVYVGKHLKSLIVIADSTGQFSLWYWNPSAKAFTKNQTMTANTNQAVTAITSELTPNGGVVLFLWKSDLTAEQWTISPDYVVTSKSTYSLYPSSNSCLLQSSIGYYWNGTNCLINCSASPAALSNAGPSQCVCEAEYTWNGQQCVRYDGIPVLEQGVRWTNATFSMPSCSSTPSMPQCNCSTSQYWSPLTQSCKPCGLLSNTNNTSDGLTCNCAAGFTWGNEQCTINCLNTKTLSTGGNANTASCLCPNSFVWNSTVNQCWRDCTTTSNSPHTNFNATQCKCNDRYAWTSDHTDCWFDCKLAYNSNGTNIDNITCGCNPQAVWNSQTLDCDIDCSGKSHSNGKNVNRTVCVCDSGYNWNYNTSTCYWNCANDEHASSNNDSQTCVCKTGYIWSGSACWIDCSNKTNSPHTAMTVSICRCDTGYYWNSTLKECLVDCSVQNHTNGTDDSNISDCRCLTYFSRVNGQCVSVDCSKVPYVGNDTTVTDGSCTCQAGYFWDPTLSACLPEKTAQTSKAVVVGVGVGVPTAVTVATVAAVVAAATATPATVIPVAAALPAVAIGSQAALTAGSAGVTMIAAVPTATGGAAGATAAHTGAVAAAIVPLKANVATATTIGSAQAIHTTTTTQAFVLAPPLLFFSKKNKLRALTMS